MAAGQVEVGSHGAARSVADLPLHRQIQFWAAASLEILSAVFYLSWVLAYGVWLDNGVYAVCIVLLLFGLSGMWLTMPNPPAPAPPPR
ncbi:MAG: hypothetical protein L3J91_00560 [Thermoplasmata archaeon]|nr:hypothetical protein [Thermoplasmata archaeon]